MVSKRGRSISTGSSMDEGSRAKKQRTDISIVAGRETTALNATTALFSLPGEIRNMIYGYMLADSVTDEDQGGSRIISFTRKDRTNTRVQALRTRRWLFPGQVCQQLRHEQRSFQQTNVIVRLDLEDVPCYIDTFYPSTNPEVARKYQGNIRACLTGEVPQPNVELLPLFSFLSRAPHVLFEPEHSNSWTYPDEAARLFHEENSLRAYIASFNDETCPVKSINLHKYYPHRHTSRGLTILFHTREPWMDGDPWAPQDTRSKRVSSRTSADKLKREARKKFVQEAGLECMMRSMWELRFAVKDA